MTLHVVYDHQCGNCEALYIPFDDDVPCPNCGTVEKERFDYIPKAADSLMFNKMSGGTYVPGAWWVGSLGDHILFLLFELFDAFEEMPSDTPFEVFVSDYLSQMGWDEQEYLEHHVRDIAVRINTVLDRP